MKHKFVEFIPDKVEEDIIYISIPFDTITHKCCCGCGNEVVTPLSPTDWTLSYDGESVSLSPSIGNWNFECKSHYWIKNNKVKWATEWSKDEIKKSRKFDKKLKEQYYNCKKQIDNIDDHSEKKQCNQSVENASILSVLKDFVYRIFH